MARMLKSHKISLFLEVFMNSNFNFDQSLFRRHCKQNRLSKICHVLSYNNILLNIIETGFISHVCNSLIDITRNWLCCKSNQGTRPQQIFTFVNIQNVARKKSLYHLQTMNFHILSKFSILYHFHK